MSRCLVVMQPTVLPWAGYFNLMAQAEDFVFYDDVQLEKRSWQTRNRLLYAGKGTWVAFPIKHQGLSQTILNTEVLFDQKTKLDLEKAFRRNYEKQAYFQEALEVFQILLDQEQKSLARINESVIEFISGKLELPTKIHRASQLKIGGERTERLISLCKYFEAEEYLSPLGAKNYLTEDHFTDKCQSRLRYQDYNPASYPQRGAAEFVSHLSILDVVANLGWASTKNYVLTGKAK